MKPIPARQPARLTKREREIRECLSNFLSSKEIAKALHISIRTVETHRKNIIRKVRRRLK